MLLPKEHMYDDEFFETMTHYEDKPDSLTGAMQGMSISYPEPVTDGQELVSVTEAKELIEQDIAVLTARINQADADLKRARKLREKLYGYNHEADRRIKALLPK